MLKNAIWIFVFALVVLIIFLPSYAKMQDLRQKSINYSLKIKESKEENTILLEEQRRLIEDPVYLESIAREKMGLVKEGEVVYKIEGEEE